MSKVAKQQLMRTKSQMEKTDTDMEALFSDIETEIASRTNHIARLEKTIETFRAKPELFDDKDFSMLTVVLQKRQEELEKLNKDFGAARELYRATVMDLEFKIKEKEELLRATDQSFGSISSENELRLYFAQKQALLQQGLQKAKAQLCATIYERLKPSDAVLVSE